MAIKQNGHISSSETLVTTVASKRIDSQVLADPQNALSDLDASKVKITRTNTPKDLPISSSLKFGTVFTDHMLLVSFDPVTGWSAPEIKPYAPLNIDPAASCFQYCPNVFEGMKAYLGPDGRPRLFRPDKNMKRFTSSAARVALPAVNTDELLKLIRQLITIDARWIPDAPGCSLYVRPTMIGTQASFGVAASEHALLYVILSPSGPFFATGPKPVSLLAVGENVRSWPGGTGGYKLGLNYAPTFLPGKLAAQKGYQQVLWLLGEDKKVTEAGAMNFFVIIKRGDGDLDAITPPLDGTILPGVTRDSALALLRAHSPEKPVIPFPSGTAQTSRIHVHERTFTLSELIAWASEGKLLEAFGVGTAVVVCPVGRIGYPTIDGDGSGKTLLKDMHLPEYDNGLGPVGHALWERIVDIQEGRVEWDDWGVVC